MHPMEICLAAGDATRVAFHTAAYDFTIKPFLRDNFTHKRAKATGDVMRLNGKSDFELSERGDQVGARRWIERRNSKHGCPDLAQLEFVRRI